MTDEEKQNPSTPEDTSDASKASPADGSGGHEEREETTSQDQTREDTHVDVEQIDPNEYKKLKREYGKLQKTQEQLKEVQKRFENVTSWTASDPNRLKQALVETSGMAPEEADEVVKQSYPDWKGKAESVEAEQVQQPKPRLTDLMDPTERALWQEQKAKAEEKRKARGIEGKKLYDKYLDDEGNLTIDEEDLKLVYRTAGNFERKGLNPSEAIEKAEKLLLKPDELVREGRLQGLAQASSTASSAQTPPLGAKTQTEGDEPYVPESEWESAKEHFKSKSEYVQFRDNPVVSVE